MNSQIDASRDILGEISFFERSDIYQFVLGYVPLKPVRQLGLNFLQSRLFRPMGITWGDDAFWIAGAENKKIYKIDLLTGKKILTIQNPAQHPGDLAWGDGFLYSLDSDKGEIYKIHPRTGNVVAHLVTALSRPHGLFWENGFLYTADASKKQVYKLKFNSNTKMSIVPIPRKIVGLAIGKDSIYMLDRRGQILKRSLSISGEETYYYNNSCRLSSITFVGSSLWGFDDVSNTLIEFGNLGFD